MATETQSEALERLREQAHWVVACGFPKRVLLNEKNLISSI